MASTIDVDTMLAMYIRVNNVYPIRIRKQIFRIPLILFCFVHLLCIQDVGMLYETLDLLLSNILTHNLGYLSFWATNS